MKRLIICLIAGCLVSSFCSAQDLPDDPVTVPGNRSRVAAPVSIAVTFIPNDTCNLVINGKDYGEVARNTPKIIKLYPGYHRLFFESLETGEAIKQRAFRLTRDSVRSGKYTYTITFKQN